MVYGRGLVFVVLGVVGVFCGGLVVGFVFGGLLILVLVYLLCSIFVVASFALCFVVWLLCLALVGSLDWCFWCLRHVGCLAVWWVGLLLV